MEQTPKIILFLIKTIEEKYSNGDKEWCEQLLQIDVKKQSDNLLIGVLEGTYCKPLKYKSLYFTKVYVEFSNRYGEQQAKNILKKYKN